MLKILHFADAHIDMANYGRHDPESGLPMRVMDFLKSLDVIVDTAISERVDLVLFAGDAYKDRTPVPTFQREWGRRIIRLSKAGIPTVLLVGNHDLSPALGRANAVEEFDTLEVPHVRVVSQPAFLRPQDLGGLPLQLFCLPWISRAGIVAHLGLESGDLAQVYEEMGVLLGELVQKWLESADPNLPTVLAAHAMVHGAVLGNERAIMLGSELILPGALVRDPRLDYVALGHIHKQQDLNPERHPPVVYPGSIERVDFGEVNDEKYFVIAQVERGRTRYELRQLEGIRPFVDRRVKLESETDRELANQRLRAALPPPEKFQDAIVRLTVDFPREWEELIDETGLREYCSGAFEFHLVLRPQMEARVRLPEGLVVGSMQPMQLLEKYWQAAHAEPGEIDELNRLAKELMEG